MVFKEFARFGAFENSTAEPKRRFLFKSVYVGFLYILIFLKSKIIYHTLFV